ncbi:hypothetical protein MTR67_027268, partial [Solanum verrucosum]
TFLIPTTQPPKGITHSHKLGNTQTQWRWKDHSKSFPTISGSASNSS